MQGGIELASNARLSNAAAGSAVIYGDVVATGKNAVISGGFKLEGGRLVFRNVSPDARDLTEMLSFTNAAEGYLAGVSEIAVDFASWPNVSTVVICPAAGLTAEAARPSVSVTVNGELFGRFNSSIVGGNVVLHLLTGRKAIIR